MAKLNKETIIYMIFVFVLNIVQNYSLDRMSDPIVDAQNMDDPASDPTIIPSHLVQQEDPLSFSEAPGPPLDPNDFSKGQSLANPEILFDDSQSDPIMMANLFQGDIRIASNDELFKLTAHASFGKGNGVIRNAIKEEEKKWNNGIIPYEISRSYDGNERAQIAKAIAEIHQETCIKFKARQGENDYIYITKGNGCSSSVGRVGGKQTVSLGAGCVYFGIILHELMHAVGFWHEQSRADRNDYVRINWGNIRNGMEYNFQKYDWTIIQNLGVNYDTGSIMHYGENAFAIDRSRPTIVAKDGSKIGQRTHFSRRDSEKINKLYKCGGLTGITGPSVTQPPPIPLPDKCLDSNDFCAQWAQAGECDTNPEWMHPNCKKSCKQCGICKDNNEWCSEWSKRGECYKSRDYMEIHCKKSCNMCNGAGAAVDCVDDNKYCKAWSEAGECKANPSYMKKSCRKSCKTC